MSRHNRDRRTASRSLDFTSLSEAIHATACAYTKDNGEHGCMTYAVIGCAYLNRATKVAHALGGGWFTTKLKSGLEVLFEHFWIMRGAPGNWTHIDFATRHNPSLIRNGFAAKFPGVALAPDEFDEKAIGIPYYVGDGNGVPWKYVLGRELSILAQAEYNSTDKNEALARLATHLKGKR